MKTSSTTYFDAERRRWRVRFRAPGLDTRFNVPIDEFEKEHVSATSTGKRAQNVAAEWAAKKRIELLGTTRGSAMFLRQIFGLMKTVNPDAVTPATWARNDIHIRNL
jgi:hypothetical protein